MCQAAHKVVPHSKGILQAHLLICVAQHPHGVMRPHCVVLLHAGPASTNPLIVNEYIGLWEHLKNAAKANRGRGGRVDIIMDNSGATGTTRRSACRAAQMRH